MSPEEFKHVETMHEISKAVFFGFFISLLVMLFANDGKAFLVFAKWIGG